MNKKEKADGTCGVCGNEVPSTNLNLFYCSEPCREEAWRFYHPNEINMIPEWFKVGVKVSFLGLSEETEVLSINLDEGSWIGFDSDGKHLYPLGEVNKYWKLVNEN